MNNSKSQSGFVMLLFVVILVVGATSYFVGNVKNYSAIFTLNKDLEERTELDDIKDQLLLYAMNFSELYANTSTSPYPNHPAVIRPGPGYLPCPYNRSTGAMSGDCSNYVVNAGADHTANPGYVIGFLPPKVSSRFFYFLGNYIPESSKNDYLLVVDERFVYQNSFYNFTGANATFRFAPLNDLLRIPFVTPAQTPVLRLNDDGKEYVALIIKPGGPNVYPAPPAVPTLDQTSLRPAPAGLPVDLSGYLDQQFTDPALTIAAPNDNQDGDFQFYTAGKDSLGVERFGVNDIIIGITYQEWQDAVKDRICAQQTQLMGTSPTVNFWFNVYAPGTNPTGSNWRGRVASGFCL